MESVLQKKASKRIETWGDKDMCLKQNAYDCTHCFQTPAHWRRSAISSISHALESWEMVHDSCQFYSWLPFFEYRIHALLQFDPYCFLPLLSNLLGFPRLDQTFVNYYFEGHLQNASNYLYSGSRLCSKQPFLAEVPVYLMPCSCFFICRYVTFALLPQFWNRIHCMPRNTYSLRVLLRFFPLMHSHTPSFLISRCTHIPCIQNPGHAYLPYKLQPPKTAPSLVPANTWSYLTRSAFQHLHAAQTPRGYLHCMRQHFAQTCLLTYPAEEVFSGEMQQMHLQPAFDQSVQKIMSTKPACGNCALQVP